jgi:hypothetical protein
LLKSLERSRKPDAHGPTKPTEDPSDAFVGTQYGAIKKPRPELECTSAVSDPLSNANEKSSYALRDLPTEPTKALAVLQSMHAENSARLNGRSIARVMLMHWRKALGIDEIHFRRILRELESSGQIIREHGYARPREQN